MNIKKMMGWKPDVPDINDNKYRAPISISQALPEYVDLRPGMPKIWSQESLGSCTSHATAAQCWYLDKTDPQEPSRLFIYYNTRILEGTVGIDSGASIRNSIKSVVRYGFCAENYCPYDITKFTKKPSNEAYKNAKTEKVALYARVQPARKNIQSALAEGLPVNFGFSVYSSFENDETANTGYVTMPSKGEELLGGHAVILCGFSNEHQHYIVRNSWSLDWGDKGYFYMPYQYVENSNLAADFWIIRAVP